MKCVLCKSSETESIYQNQNSLTTDRRYTDFPVHTLACNSCGVVFDSQGARTNATKFYAESYDLHGESAQSEFQIHTSDSSRGENDAILEFISANIPRSNFGSMLEVGCGKGILLSKFIKQNPKWDVCAIEPSNNAALYFRKALPEIDFFEGILRDSPFSQREFDFVATSGVIEHVPDPMEFLGEIRSCLKSNGLAYIGVPNFEVKPDDLLVFDHLTQFTPASLDYLYAQVGLKLVARSSRKDRIWLWDIVEKSEPVTAPKAKNINVEIERAKNHALELARQKSEFDRMMASLQSEKGVGAIFGIGVSGLFWYAQNYKGNPSIKYILDDNPHSWGSSKLDLEMHGSESIKKLCVTHIFLGANPCYHQRMRSKLIDLGVDEKYIYG